ncbi:MAG: DinB family protein [Thermoanaerobaculia bacterium]
MALDLKGKLSGRFAARLTSQFGSWVAVAGDLDLPNLERVPAPGKWSARQHLAHLARIHEVYGKRIDSILSEGAPALPAYRAENDPDWPSWDRLPVGEVFERARRLRSRMIDQILPLTDLDLARIGVHGRLGPLPLSLWLEFFLSHEGHHLYEILKLVREP